MNNETNANTELAVVNPGEMFRIATDVAGVCGAIVKQTAVNIQGKKYVKAEGWNAIAAAHGCAAGILSVEPTEGGVKAVAQLKRLSDGMPIATAEGFVGDDEDKWAKGPEYARRAMAQTRAISRVCRSAFAHVVVLIDAGLQTTPAEEVPDNGFTQDKPSKPLFRTGTNAFQAAKRVMQEPTGEPGTWRDVQIHFGKNSGRPLGELNTKQLNWYADEWVDKKQSDTREPSAQDRQLVDALLLYKRERKEHMTAEQFNESQQREHEEIVQEPMPY